MNIFPFNIRSDGSGPEAHYLRRIVSVLEDVEMGIARQNTMILDRYNRAIRDAAFALDALENDPSPAMSIQANKLAASMDDDRDRLVELDRQAAIVARLQALLAKEGVRSAVHERQPGQVVSANGMSPSPSERTMLPID